MEESIGGGWITVDCHMDPNISKVTTGKERVVATCAESQSVSPGTSTGLELLAHVSVYVRVRLASLQLLFGHPELASSLS